jgi:hypothetical protein
MRFFINEYYKSTKKRLNHLHDCVCIHPNDVDTFYKIASEIYCKPEMKTLAEDLIFENIIHNSVKPQTSELIELKNEFISNKDKSNFTLKGFFFLFLKLILREEDEKRNNRP